MTQVVPPPGEQGLASMAQALETAQALAQQQQQSLTTADGDLAVNFGILAQQPPSSGSPTNYTSGWGFEIPSDGVGSVPVMRAGLITWTSPVGGTVTILGLAFFDSSGNVRVVWNSTGATAFDASGNAVGSIISY